MSETSAPSSARHTRRADAQRNIDRIIEAGQRLYAASPSVSMSDVAKEAGVGRVTLYAHFPSRGDLARAVVEKAISEALVELNTVDVDHLPADQALDTLLRNQWHLLDRYHGLHANMMSEVDPAWFRERHDPVFSRIDQLLERGRTEGVFRTDLPVGWLVTTMYHLIHAASDELAAGHLGEDEALDVLAETLMSVLKPSGR